MEEEKKDSPETKKTSASYSIISLLCSIAVGLCWLFRDFQFRHKINGTGTAGQNQHNFLMLDINIALRRAMLVLAIIGLVFGLKAVIKRCRFFDLIAFLIAAVVALSVGYIVYQMGGKGFWIE